MWSISLKVGTFVAAAAALVTMAGPAKAVPSFARQTGLACEACHTVFPELTPFGREFKMNGYVLTTKQQISDINSKRQDTLSLANLPPLSVMLQASSAWWNTAPKDANFASGSKAQNGEVQFPQQFSFFYAGKIADQLGAFFQLTYSQSGGSFAIDNSDVRYADHNSANTLVWGVSLNNNPTVQDLWNSTPAWGFPYYGMPDNYPAPTPDVLINTLGQNAAGLTAYVDYKNSFYVEGGAYRTALQGTSVVDSAASTNGVIDNYAPYWRAAYEKDWKNNSLEVGTFGMYSKFQPSGIANSTYGNDVTDTGFDGQYQFIGQRDIVSLLGSYIHEHIGVNNGLGPNGTAAYTNSSDNLNKTNIAASYYYHRKYGAQIGFTDISGTKDAAFYGNSAGLGTSSAGSLDGSPDSQFETLQVDYLPWLNTKLLLQYTMYNSFNGGGTYHDTATTTRRASDNNTLMAAIWTAF
jgi:hypothetical protein